MLIFSVGVPFPKFDLESKCGCSVAAAGIRPIRRWQVSGDGPLDFNIRAASCAADICDNRSLRRSTIFCQCHGRVACSSLSVQGQSIQNVPLNSPEATSCRKSRDRDCGREHFAMNAAEKQSKFARGCGRVYKGRAFKSIKTDRAAEGSLSKLCELQLVTDHGWRTSVERSTSLKTQELSSDAALVTLDAMSDFMLPEPKFQLPVVMSRHALNSRAQTIIASRVERTSDAESELLATSSFMQIHSGNFPRNVSSQVCSFLLVNSRR